jgi:hypothetical protein
LLGAIAGVPHNPDSARCGAQLGAPIITGVPPHLGGAPFGIGERLEYRVSFGVSFVSAHVGTAVMLLADRDTVRGQPVWRAMLTISGGRWVLAVHDTTTSWFDTATFTPLRFTQRLHEPKHSADRAFEIFPGRRTFQARGDPERASVADPLDDVSFLYFVRTLPLEIGQCYQLHRYFRPEGNPVVLRVVRRERIVVPAGTFNAIVVQPEITTSGIFSKDGRAEVWFTDDSARVLLQLKSKMSFGSINLYLSKLERSRPSP